jgi:hypothetical protein
VWRVARTSFEGGNVVSRRAWLIAAGLACAGAWARADEPAPARVDTRIDPLSDEDREQAAVEALGEKLGLGPMRVSRTANYLGIGDAVDVFRSRALADCEAVRSDFMDFYRARGFDVAAPPRRLTVVALTDDRSFAAFLGKRDYAVARESLHGPTIHGVYQPRTNRLVVFDHRSLGRERAPLGGLDNLRALAHEATHQLTFNTGLLERRGDVPLCISEGLAMYGEHRKPGTRTPPGELNPTRLKDLSLARFKQVAWIPVDDLLAHDHLLRGPGLLAGKLLAYAESWLLIHYLMSEPPSRVDFRLYLKAIRGRETPVDRLDDARTHLGDLDRLNQSLREYMERLRKSSAEKEI